MSQDRIGLLALYGSVLLLALFSYPVITILIEPLFVGGRHKRPQLGDLGAGVWWYWAWR